MNDISPENITEIIYRQFSYFNPPISLSSTILKAAFQVRGQLSELALTEDILDRDLQEYVAFLVKREQELRSNGLFCPYQVYPDNDQIVGFSYPRSTDSPLMKRVRLVAPEVKQALESIRDLHHKEFELFCSKILDLLKAEETLKTQDSRDEGIDFLGWLCIPNTFSMTETSQFGKEFRMLVLGQAKKYKPEKPVGVSHIRELVGTVAAFHHDQLSPWESRLQLPAFTVLAPILPLIMTTGRMSKDARMLAKKCGVVTRDGAEIALFICLEGVGMINVEINGTSRPKFDAQAFTAWLHQISV